MFAGISALLAAWSLLEPAASLLVYITAILLSGVVFARSWNGMDAERSFVRTLYLAILSGFVFTGITGMSYFLLNSSYGRYAPMLESLAQGEKYKTELQEAQKKWGSSIVQGNLDVAHTFAREEVQQIRASNGKTYYINRTVNEKVEQETITSFAGVVDVHVVNPYLNTYEASVVYRYRVVNQSDLPTVAHFTYPVDRRRIYRNMLVTVDGNDLASSKELSGANIIWNLDMMPHQGVDVVISYQTQGSSGYMHKIADKDVVQGFSFIINSDSRNLYALARPDTTAIEFDSQPVDSGYHLAWVINRAILSPEVGIRFKPGAVPDLGHKRVLQMTQYSPRGVMFLMIVSAFTMLICGVTVNLWRLSLVAVVYSSQFLTLIGLDLLNINGWLVLPLLFPITFMATRYVYPDLPRLPFSFIMIAVTLFALAYPYAGLLPDGPGRTAFDAVVQALIILYIFGLSLYIRIRNVSPSSRDG